MPRVLRSHDDLSAGRHLSSHEETASAEEYNCRMWRGRSREWPDDLDVILLPNEDRSQVTGLLVQSQCAAARA
jgi:hypothetical protein